MPKHIPSSRTKLTTHVCDALRERELVIRPPTEFVYHLRSRNHHDPLVKQGDFEDGAIVLGAHESCGVAYWNDIDALPSCTLP